MDKFSTLASIAAPLSINNIDTDMIIPKQFLTTIKRTGLSEGLFFEMRYDEAGNKIENFILHQHAYSKSQILVAGDNFGCGSSREHAPWALLDFGIKCIIAPSFADIFYNNCFKNGILPIATKDAAEILEIASQKETNITVDLPAQTISIEGGKTYKFDIAESRKNVLINGLDDISMTLQNEQDITNYEQKIANAHSWK